jgi:phospholipase/carboxylesterase
MDAPADELLDATTALIPPLLTALDALAFAGRHLHPPELPALIEHMAAFRQPLADGLRVYEAVSWPDHLALFASSSRTAAQLALEALDVLQAAPGHSSPVVGAYRAMGFHARALEALYPVAFMLPPVNRFYLSAEQRGEAALQEKLLQADLQRGNVGVMHADNDPAQRGGFSVYVPEYHEPGTPMPLVVALHGGSGHGRGFLWTWLVDARSRGAIVVAPTSLGDTWSLMDPDADTANLIAMVERVGSLWDIDPRHLLLTGMSDGGTFSFLAGLREGSPFTHLAPIASAFHPLLLHEASPARLQGLPIYLIHGALDWMFAVDMAQLAYAGLAAAGADVTYRELPDLSHTYPREQNARILDWLLGS